MNSRDYLMTIAARSGLGLDAQNGTICGKVNGFQMNLVEKGSKFTLVMSFNSNGSYPSAEKVEGLLSSFDFVKSVSFENNVYKITIGSYSKNIPSIDLLISSINSIAKKLAEAGYEDASDINEEAMEIKGKNVSSLGGNPVAEYLTTVFGIVLGLSVAILIKWGFVSINFLFGAVLTTFLLLLLPVVGFELFQGKKSIIGLAILLIFLLIGSDILVRFQTAGSTWQELQVSRIAISQLNEVMVALEMEPININADLKIGDIFFMLPPVFKASGNFLTDLIVGYIDAITVFVLAVVSYYKGNKSIFSLLMWLYNAIFARGRN